MYGRKISKKKNVKVRSFLGATTSDMTDFVKSLKVSFCMSVLITWSRAQKHRLLIISLSSRTVLGTSKSTVLYPYLLIEKVASGIVAKP